MGRHLSICPMLLVLFTLASVAAYVLPSCSSVRSHTARVSTHVSMDETIMQKALAGELEEEGAENVFMSEVGWASYLDKEAKSSYNMNQRPSMADDGYFTPSIFSNPLDVLVAWKDALFGAASNPRQRTSTPINALSASQVSMRLAPPAASRNSPMLYWVFICGVGDCLVSPSALYGACECKQASLRFLAGVEAQLFGSWLGWCERGHSSQIFSCSQHEHRELYSYRPEADTH